MEEWSGVSPAWLSPWQYCGCTPACCRHTGTLPNTSHRAFTTCKYQQLLLEPQHDISSKIRLNNQQQQATDNSFTATLTTACDTSLTKNIFLKKFIFASLYCNSNFHSVPLFEGPSLNISNLSGPLRCSQLMFNECICRVSANSSF